MLAPSIRGTVVVGFRDPTAGLSFYYQTWIRMEYEKATKVGRAYQIVKKKVVRIKKVAEFWPSQRTLGNAWKDMDLVGAG